MSASDMSGRFGWSLRSSYEYAAELTLRDWAWEFLRRNPEFQMAWWKSRDAFEITFSDSTLTIIHARANTSTLKRWGCLYTDAPDIDARSANVFWLPSRNTAVLRMHAVPANAKLDTALFNLRRQPCPVSLLTMPGNTQHVLFHGSGHGIRLAVSGASLLEPVYLLADSILGRREAKPRIEALRRYNDFIAGMPSPSPANEQTARLRNVLQALDGSLAGVSNRDIALALFGVDRVEADWNDPGENMRDRVRRAVKRGRDLMNGSYLKFLR